MRKLPTIAIRTLAPLMIVAVIPFMPGHATTTQAGGLVVTTTDDSGSGSFRDALGQAMTNVGADTITFDPTTFPPGNPATIHATAVYEVDGPAASDPLTISALGAGVIFDFTGVTEGQAAFDFEPDGAINGLTMKNFTIQNYTPDTNHQGHGIEIGFAQPSVSNLDIENMTITGNSEDGLFLNAEENFEGLIESNHITDNGGVGIHISAGTASGLFIQENDITGNGSKGIDLDVTDPDVASTAFITANTVSDNSNDGIFIGGPETTNAIHATISNNVTFGNGGIGINLLGFGNEFGGVTENDAGDTDAGANDLLNFPVLNGVSQTGIVGIACANCTIEIFLSDNDPTGYGEGQTFVASGTADGGGNFDVEGCVAANASVTATATDPIGNTSEFALNYTVPSSTCSGLHTQGDLDCDGDVDGRDALAALIYRSNTDPQLSQEPGCLEIGQNTQPVSIGIQGSTYFGDVNCSGLVDETDALMILWYAAHGDHPLPRPIDCTPIGGPISIT
ncbi:MAG: right-handed parallel beta-helix repeat-containing protein [Chloroflexota bacterium]